MTELHRHKLIAIIRGIPEDKLDGAVRAAYRGGIRAFEITYDPSDIDTLENTARAFETVQKATGGDAILGAGTVVKPEYVPTAYQCGAKFIVSPDINEAVMSLTKENGMISIPGAFTPGEVMSAYRAGADIVKIFPIYRENIPYLKKLLAPLSFVPFMPTGGVNLDTAAEFMRIGAAVLAAGDAIFDRDAVMSEDFQIIEDNARKLLYAINNAR